MTSKNKEYIERNNLDKASSAYLTSAKNQPVHWQEWDDSVFRAAQKFDLPILLDIGAVWCHWCHVMDRESYENEHIANIINQHFIPVKVDRDERPDVDKRYQTFVQATGGGGGWPLTCFLTPDGKLFYGGTYYPPEDKMGRPGFKSLLTHIAQTFRERRKQVEENSSELFQKIFEYEKSKTRHGELDVKLAASILNDIEKNFDPVYGGFGIAPKFPNGSAYELVLTAYDMTRNSKYLDIARIGLDNIAAGGIHDHLAGGFHRYSIDQYWHIPHFEKMTSDNAEFLMNYLHLYQATEDSQYKEAAEGIIGYYTRDMTDQVNGGFYAHQDADITLEDDGDYFTWTKQEISDLLDSGEERLFNLYFGISEQPNDLHTTPDRNVLYRVRKIEPIADELKISLAEAKKTLSQAMDKLLKARYKRQAPFIDKTIFANINGMMLTAYSEAYKVLKDPHIKQFSIKTADFLLERLYTDTEGFLHAYTLNKAHIQGFLQDQVCMADALLGVYEISGDLRYLNTTKEVMQLVNAKYLDKKNGGYFDRRPERDMTGVMAIGHKPIEDVPVASSNSVAIRVLDRLFSLTGDEQYHSAAENALKTFAGSFAQNGTYYSSYGLSLLYHLNPPPTVIILGDRSDSETIRLAETALSVYRPGKQVYLFDPGDSSLDNLPNAVRLKISGTKQVSYPVVYICSDVKCAPPVHDPDGLKKVLKTFGKRETHEL